MQKDVIRISIRLFLSKQRQSMNEHIKCSFYFQAICQFSQRLSTLHHRFWLYWKIGFKTHISTDYASNNHEGFRFRCQGLTFLQRMNIFPKMHFWATIWLIKFVFVTSTEKTVIFLFKRCTQHKDLKHKSLTKKWKDLSCIPSLKQKVNFHV